MTSSKTNSRAILARAMGAFFLGVLMVGISSTGAMAGSATSDAEEQAATTAALPGCDTVVGLPLLSNSSIKGYFGWETAVFADDETWQCYNYYGQPYVPYASAIMNIQRTLNQCYGENLVVDGDFGSLTRAAVIRMQQTEGLIADGYYGPQSQQWSKHRATNGSCYYGTAFDLS
ncbi:peptidoglycan-binding domain-containing protein [Ruania rhizosphaerae]|uniref:peptidoglycan-binding domain-containing protein n=1 Tax=Ruania rhizosphaerae TaxID=1840413 RepID=UPI00190F0A6E|nr:peptidoglycan-binding domain-containing protein [Ruania rhizosphaerae]